MLVQTRGLERPKPSISTLESCSAPNMQAYARGGGLGQPTKGWLRGGYYLQGGRRGFKAHDVRRHTLLFERQLALCVVSKRRARGSSQGLSLKVYVGLCSQATRSTGGWHSFREGWGGVPDRVLVRRRGS